MKRYLLLGLLPLSAFAQTANISRTDGSIAGQVVSSGLQNASGKTYFQNDGRTFLVVHGGGSAVTATVTTQRSSVAKDGYGTVSLSNQDISVPSGSYVIAGPFPKSRWNTVNDTVEVSFTSVTGVSATAIRAAQ